MTQDESRNLSLCLPCWPSSVMVTHLDNRGSSEPWKMTLSSEELHFADFSWTLDHLSCSFVLDHTSNAFPDNFIQYTNLIQVLEPLQRALTQTFYFLTSQTSIHLLKHPLQNFSDIPVPLSLTCTGGKHSFLEFLQHFVYISILTQYHIT